MEKLLEKKEHRKFSWRRYLNSRVLFVVIGVLTVFNLGANLFNSYMAFTSKADQQILRESQRQILINQDRLEFQQKLIENMQTQQNATKVRADDSDKRQDKSDMRQTKNEKNANASK